MKLTLNGMVFRDWTSFKQIPNVRRGPILVDMNQFVLLMGLIIQATSVQIIRVLDHPIVLHCRKLNIIVSVIQDTRRITKANAKEFRR